MKKTTKNWLATSDYDIETAKHMLETGRYIYVIFMCHLSVEKLLKAIVAESIEELPPKTHNLRYLVKLGGLSIPGQQMDILDKLNTVSVPTRYPEDLVSLQKQFDREIATEYLSKTKELLKWLRQDKRLKK